jgi:hypothetical protein
LGVRVKIDSTGSGQCPVAGFCEHWKYVFGSQKRKKFLFQLSNYKFFNKVKLVFPTHLHLAERLECVELQTTSTPTPLGLFMAWSLIKRRDNFNDDLSFSNM